MKDWFVLTLFLCANEKRVGTDDYQCGSPKDEPGSYQILNRAIFYVSRLISSQREQDFVKSNYNDIKTVYSIWVCMNMPENSMCHIYLTKEDLLGKHN